MGNISFLTGGNPSSPQSIAESIYQLENTSVVFLSAWQRTTPDFQRAARASQEAMLHLDHIVNEIMRNRDQLQADGTYTGSQLEGLLNISRAVSVSPVTRAEQDDLANYGPGNGVLPSAGSSISMEKLLNKIKHRRTNSANFRIGASGEHIFIIGVDKPNRQPDSIVEFIVGDFCQHCSDIAALI
ncbi:hypothetical protein HRJ35_11970 [Shewanella oneidensis MR-1]|uniref:Uncharacterized protein n=1 Tax=Shewanella oneidensis (strain ATCC 700550 / JCM 31522 / CIP 106686 / LMG 19005 / NCIMB 14063 / MR-1) TaxID=211586 RepID=Q8EFE6_SHEON|nr:hypothetical protein [Shewanella oneidensis]AAN55081.1 uncharacterized protein SO_2034 [Shewanella oneidensis MR-1]MDX5996220.1 hypothetical protein [Shewanella oneidensis]MEE2030473.1 hypothetical protein [Shewanella oneidensis]QKG96656.1 hypothetical protein HRJ35_11970 [Shewanella oneidensis MR-1]